jgi:predicted DNA-binding transcriptional regulator AlpA
MSKTHTIAVAPRGMRTPEAAAYVGLSPTTLNIKRCQGNGPAYHKVGGKIVVYFQEDLDAWLASSRRQSTSQAAAAAVR